MADAMAQFLRGCHRVGHHQDLADGQVLLQDEPQEESGYREGLAGAVASLDQAGAGPQLRLGQLEDRHRLHAPTSFSALSSGSNTARAVAWNSSSRGSVLRKQRDRKSTRLNSSHLGS